MEIDNRLLWIENRIQHSLKIKIEELKCAFKNDHHVRKLRHFLNISHCSLLFAYHNDENLLIISTESPTNFVGKGILFCKLKSVKVTLENIDEQISVLDLSENIIDFSETIIRDIFLPLACSNTISSVKKHDHRDNVETTNTISDKMVDVVHRLIENLQVASGLSRDKIVLVHPNVEVLQDLLSLDKKKGLVVHVLETTVISWCKQIKGLLLRENIYRKQKVEDNTPLTEIELWKSHLETVISVQKQLHLPCTKEILGNLERVDSPYYRSFADLMIEISEEKLLTKDMLKYLNPLAQWFEKFDFAKNTKDIISLIPPLLRLVFLLWKFNSYYHMEQNICRFLRIFINKVMEKVFLVIGDYKVQDNGENLQNFKNALKICAKFRGTYLDTRDLVDEVNKKNETTSSHLRHESSKGKIWKGKVYSLHTYKSSYKKKSKEAENNTLNGSIDDLSQISVWPSRNSPCFQKLNRIIQRCNDCVEFLESMEHFRSLSNVARIGGASTSTLNAMVTEIDNRFQIATKHFYKNVSDILDFENSAIFQRVFFEFRCVVKELEYGLGVIIDKSLDFCPTVESKLHMIEVFEGTSGRDIVQKMLAGKLQWIVTEFKAEVEQIRSLLENKERLDKILNIKHVPSLINRFVTLEGLKNRIYKPLDQLIKVFPNVLTGEHGWTLRQSVDEVLEICNKMQLDVVKEWSGTLSLEMIEYLRQPILIFENGDSFSSYSDRIMAINIDFRLVSTIKEIKFLNKNDPNFQLSETCQQILRSTEGINIDLYLRKLNLIVFQFNYANRSMSIFERGLLLKDLDKINEILQVGAAHYSWKMPESFDFIEKLLFLVSNTFWHKLIVVQENLDKIIEIGNSWSRGNLDIFSSCYESRTNNTCKLQSLHKKLEEEIKLKLTCSQSLIEKIINFTLEVIEINQDSSVWTWYIDYIDAMILESIKNSVLMSLSSLQMHINKESSETAPLLSINLDLCAKEITFLIPLFPTLNRQSISEIVMNWVQDYLCRSKSIKLFHKKREESKDLESKNNVDDEKEVESFYELLKDDEDIRLQISTIENALQQTVSESMNVLELFNDYSFLWIPDIDQSFQHFLSGCMTPNPRRSLSKVNYRSSEMLKSQLGSSRTTSSCSKDNSFEEEQAERSFLIHKNMMEIEASNIPCLDDFHVEIDLYSTAIEELEALPKYKDYGCLRIVLDPLRQVLIFHGQSWIWKYCQYLCEQVTFMLKSLEIFIIRVEPQVDSITGTEKDTDSFMRLMRLFNEISTQQAIIQNKFSAMHKAVDIVQLYSPNLLDEDIIQLYQTLPDRWTSLKTKVSSAKQRLSPHIQEESDSVSKDLISFRERVDKFEEEFHKCEAYYFDSPMEGTRIIIENFDKRINLLKNEASDLIELQNLLQHNIVNFETIQRCMVKISALREIWEVKRKIQNEQQEWKRHRWTRMNPDYLAEATDNQLSEVEKLPVIVKSTEVFILLKKCVMDIKLSIPLLIDLSNKTMRTRHWKQLVRAVGGSINLDCEILIKMTFGELLSLGLQQHLSEIQMIVERANQDSQIENSLKTYEEVWLSKTFQFTLHPLEDLLKEEGKVDLETPLDESRKPGSRLRLRSVSCSRNQRSRTDSSVLIPFGISQNINEDELDKLPLLCNSEEIFTKLGQHQKSLDSMIKDNSAIGGFLDDVLKWKAQLRNIESILKIWLKVQNLWKKLYQIFLWKEVQSNMVVETKQFKSAHKDFALVMIATKQNSNILQSCNRKNMKSFIEDLLLRLNYCKEFVMNFLNNREHLFPKFYLLSNNDIFELIGSGSIYSSKYVDKLWPNIECLKMEMIYDDSTQANKTSLLTKDGEIIQIGNVDILQESTELTLMSLEKAIQSTLKAQLSSFLNKRRSLTDLITLAETISKYIDEYGENRDNSDVVEVFKTSSQIICLACRIITTEEIDRIVTNPSDSEIVPQLEKLFQTLTNTLFLLNSVNYKINNTLNHCSENSTDRSLMEDIKLKIRSCTLVLSEYCIFLTDFIDISSFYQRKLSHDWYQYAKFYFHKENEITTVDINICGHSIQYSFDIVSIYSIDSGSDFTIGLGSINQYDLYNVLTCHHCFPGALCYTDQNTMPSSLLSNISSHIGKYFYSVDCSWKTDPQKIIRILKSHFNMDSWICLRNFDRLLEDSKAVIQQAFILIETGEVENGDLHILGTKININTRNKGAIFLTLDGLNGQFSDKTDFLRNSTIISSLIKVPVELLNRFRLINIRQLNTSKILESMMYAMGFKNCGTLSKWLTNFLMLINSQFSIQIDANDSMEIDLKSDCLFNSLISRMEHISQTVKSDQSESLILEKIIIYEALKENYSNLLSKDQYGNFIEELNTFWKVDFHNISDKRIDSVTEDFVKEFLNDILKEKCEFPLTNDIKNQIVQIFDNLRYSKAVGVIGATGTGKTTAIDMGVRLWQRKFRKEIMVEKIYPNSYSDIFDFNLINSPDMNIFQNILAQFCDEHYKRTLASQIEYFLIIDGKFTMDMVEWVCNCLSGTQVVLSNEDRLVLPMSFHILFELEFLGNLHPGLISLLSLVSCDQNEDDLVKNGSDWKKIVNNILRKVPATNNENLQRFIESSVPPIVEYLDEIMYSTDRDNDSMLNNNPKININSTIVNQSWFGALSTFVNYLSSLLSSSFKLQLNQDSINNLVAYSLLWAFSGFISENAKILLSDKIKDIFQIKLSPEHQQFSLLDLHLDIDKMKWYPWSELITTQVITKNSGFILDRIVKTPSVEACIYNLNLLIDNGYPVLLVGNSGSGKTLIVKDRLKALCSGEVGDVLNVSADINVYSKTSDITTKLVENIQWEHSSSYTPIGYKKLIIFLDDLNSSGKNSCGENSVNEFVREILDSAGFWHYQHLTDKNSYSDSEFSKFQTGFTKMQLKNINIVATLDAENVVDLNQRMLRHFNIINLNKPSMEDQKSIFSVLINGHLFGSSAMKNDGNNTLQLDTDAYLPQIIDQLIKVTVDLQERLNHQFKLIKSKPAHYRFNMNSLVQIFYNFCQSITFETVDVKDVFLAWKNECLWAFEKRMVDQIHISKYREAYESAVKGEFADKYKSIDLPMATLLDSHFPLFSTVKIVKSDGQISMTESRMTRGIYNQNYNNISKTVPNSSNQLSKYDPVTNERKLADNLNIALVEYNKVHMPIRINMHRANMSIICRVSRILNLNENMGHCLLVGDGSPGLTTTLLKLSAHISGFQVVYPNSSILNINDYSIDAFRNELNKVFVAAGSKNEKFVMVIRDRDLTVPGVSQCIQNFVINMSIEDIFSFEQQTHVVNAVRTGVLKSGLNYSRNTAWNFFVQNVIKCFRFAIIVNNCHTSTFQTWAYHNRHLVGKLNILWNMMWNGRELLDNTRYILESFPQINEQFLDNEKENCCHFLSNIHIALQEFEMSRSYSQQLGLNSMTYANNISFERFVEKFCQLVNVKLHEIAKDDQTASATLSFFNEQNELVNNLSNQVNHEKQILLDKINATTSILNQIGENTLIVRSQMKEISVKIEEIKQLKKLVPEYKLAHDRYSYKAIAAFNRARDVVKNIDIDSLASLRSINNPPTEVVELMEAVIIIIKSASSDRTWNTGAKRLLANLERFIVDLLTFDERTISDESLNFLELRSKNTKLEPDKIMESSGMTACADLCKWVRHVTQYYVIIQNKVKPLHHKLEETTKNVTDSEFRIKALDEKRKSLDYRLQDLSNNYEQATLDRYYQEIKNAKVTEMFLTSKSLIDLLENTRQRASLLKSSYKKRRANIIGTCAIAAGFVTYLGYFDTASRRVILTNSWPRCVQDRGLNLTFDVVHNVQGLNVLFEYPFLNPKSIGTEEKDENDLNMETQSKTSEVTEAFQNNPLSDAQYFYFIKAIGELVLNQKDNCNHTGLELEQDFLISCLQESILLAGNKDRFSVIVDSSGLNGNYYIEHWQQFGRLLSQKKDVNKKDVLQIINTDLLTPSALMNRLEEAVTNGWHTVIKMKRGKLDRFVESFIQYFLSKNVTDEEFDTRIIQIGNRHLFVEEGFKCLLITESVSPKLDRELYSQANIVNWKMTENQIVDIMAGRCLKNIGKNFSKIRSQSKTNAKHRVQLRILIQEFESVIAVMTMGKPHQNTFKLWNEENLRLLRLIIESEEKLKQYIKEFDRFVGFLDHERMRIKRQLSKMEVILQCVMNMGNINHNILFTPSTFLEIFDRIMSEMTDIQFDNSPSLIEELDSSDNILSIIENKPSTKSENKKIDDERFMKESSLDEMPKEDQNEEDDQDFISQLLASIDNDEKEVLAHEITGIRPLKSPFKLKSFEFYMERRGIVTGGRSRLKENCLTKSLYKDEEENVTKTDQDQMDLTETLNRIQIIITQIDVDNQRDDSDDAKFEWKSISDKHLKDLVEKFEDEILYRLKLCLTDEDFLIYRFIYSLWLSEDPVNAPTPMELEFFIHGCLRPEVKLSLSDFECFADVPGWIPPDMWQEILAASVLPGPLEALCVKVAENSDKWKSWCNSEQVENYEQMIPLDTALQNSDNEMFSPTVINEFTKLILLRIFRPDCCKALMDKTMTSKLNDQVKSNIDLNTVIKDCSNLKCVIISKNPSPSPNLLSISSLKSDTSSQIILEMAKRRSLVTSFFTCSTSSKSLVTTFLEDSAKTSDWIVFDFMIRNLAEPLKIIDQFIKNQNSKLCWIITSETDQVVKIFDSITLDKSIVISAINLSRMTLSMDKILISSECNSIIKKVFQTSLNLFECHTSLISKLLTKNQSISKSIIFRLVYINSMMMIRSMLGTRGFSVWKPMPSSFVKDQLLFIDSLDVQSCFESPENIGRFVNDLTQLIFTKWHFDPIDLRTVKTIGDLLFQDIKTNFVRINGVEISFPEYQTDVFGTLAALCRETWFIDKNFQKLACTEFESSMFVNASATQRNIETIESFLNSFIHQHFPDNDLSSCCDDIYATNINRQLLSLSKNKLQAKTLYLMEHLPPPISKTILSQNCFQIPQKLLMTLENKSLKDNSTSGGRGTEIIHEIKSLKPTDLPPLFYLLRDVVAKEIRLFNRKITKIINQLHRICQTSEDDFVNMTQFFIDVCCDIVDEKVPHSWTTVSSPFVHTTHRLTTFLKNITKHRHQLIKLSKEILNSFGNISTNRLPPSLWLGGFSQSHNALLIRMRSIYSNNEFFDLEKMKIVTIFPNTEMADIQITKTFLIGAHLNLEDGKICLSERFINKISAINIRFVHVGKLDRSMSYYNCPVYFDLSRRVLIDYVLFPSDDNIQALTLSGVFMVLDIGCNENCQLNKERIPILVSPTSITLSDISSPTVLLTRKFYEDKFTGLHPLVEEDYEYLDKESNAIIDEADALSKVIDQSQRSPHDQTLNDMQKLQSSPFLLESDSVKEGKEENVISIDNEESESKEPQTIGEYETGIIDEKGEDGGDPSSKIALTTLSSVEETKEFQLIRSSDIDNFIDIKNMDDVGKKVDVDAESPVIVMNMKLKQENINDGDSFDGKIGESNEDKMIYELAKEDDEGNGGGGNMSFSPTFLSTANGNEDMVKEMIRENMLYIETGKVHSDRSFKIDENKNVNDISEKSLDILNEDVGSQSEQEIVDNFGESNFLFSAHENQNTEYLEEFDMNESVEQGQRQDELKSVVDDS